MNITCADCGFEVTGVRPETIARGSSVRDPGEAVCHSCSATRIRLLRDVDLLPDSLQQIKARRMDRSLAAVL